MADFEDESSANLAPVNGLQENAAGPQDPSLGPDSSQFSKQYDPFSAPPSSMMDQHDFDSLGYQYQGDTDYPPANEPVSRDFGAFQDDHDDADLPANFAREAARHQDDFEDGEGRFEEQEHPDMTPAAGGRGDEAEEAMPQGQDSNPFGVGAGDQGMDVAPVSGSGSYADSNDRPIMGYNPFLNEENREEVEEQRQGEEGEEDDEEVGEGRFDQSQEEAEFYKQQQQQQSFAGVPGDFGRPEHDERMDEERQVHHYDRLEEDDDDDDEDDADLQMEPVENIQQPPDFGMAAEKEEIAESKAAVEDDRLMTQMEDSSQLTPSFTDSEQTQPEDTCPAQEPDESSLGFDSQPEGFDSQPEGLDSQPAEPDFGPQDEIVDQTSDYQPPQSQDTVPADDIDFEKTGGFEEEQREEESLQVEAKRGGEEEELGIDNQAFSDDVDMEVSKGIQEEEKEEKFEEQQVPATEMEPKFDEEERRDEYMEEEKEQEVQDEKQEVQDENQEVQDERPSELEETEIKQAGDEGEERGEVAGEQEKQVEMNEEERFSAPADEPAEVTQAEQIDSTKGDYSQEQMRSDEDEEEITEKYSEEIESEKDLGSRLPESDMFSSEQEDRSFVDNLSELTSPVIPQRLPSPPEPKDMSPFDPLAPANSNSISPCHEPEGNLGQQPGEIFEQEVAADETNTGDFLTAGEVEGETKFGVDGTAITQTATQNNAFLHSDDEEDEEEEESQPLDQGGLATTGTTETENSTESGGQGFETMEGNDNALMSMSMEGSFYDDGGELIGGGEDRREAAVQENHVYSEEAISEESYSQQDTYVEKQDSYSMSQYEEQLQQQQEQQIQNDFHPEQDTNAFGLTQDTFATTQNAFDPLSNATAPPAAAVNGLSDEGGNMGGLDSLLDAPVTEQGLQTPVTEKGGTVDSSVDSAGIDSIAREFESSVDFQQPQQPEVPKLDLDDAAPAKPEEPSSSVDEPPAPGAKEESQEAPAAAAAPDAGEAPAAAAAASGTTKASTTTTTVKKTSSAKAGGKTTTTTTTTKTTKETKTASNRAAATRKTETTTSTATSKTTPRKPGDSRPASAATSEKKPGSAKSATSPTKPSSAKPPGPLPSYAQPITPRKPREAKVPTPDEKKTLTKTPRLPSAGPKTTRPQSATTTSSTTRSTTRTTTSTVSSTSRTAQLARPKSSPTKLTNGTPGGPSDTKSPTKKYGIDARNEGYKPGGGNVKITSEKKEYKATSRIDAGAKGATPGAAAPKPAPAKSSPRTPKTGEAKSKIGSMDNATHSPGGGNVRIQSKKTDFSTVGSRIGSKDKMDHKPGGGNVKIENRKLKVEAKSRIGSLDNAKHTPAGGDKKIESHKLDFKDKASPKIGSLDKPRTTSASGSEEGATEIPAANGATSDN